MQRTIANLVTTRFREIQDVKRASTRPEANLTFRNHEPDVIVETWMNSRLNVYIVQQAPKSRRIKTILKHNTSSSIGTLFLIKGAILPADGYCGKLHDLAA